MKLKIATVMTNKREDGSFSTFLVLGNKNKTPTEANKKFENSVEIIVRNHEGKVVYQQLDGFISLEDPRTRPQELLKAKAINEDMYNKMMERVARMSEKVVREVVVDTSKQR